MSINEQVDESPAGKLLEGMIEVIDEFYSINLAQDTLRGMKENAGRGYHNGIVPIGYRAKKFMVGPNEKTRLEPDEVFAPIIQRIFQMCTDGRGAKEIVKTLNSEGLRTNKGKLWDKNNVYYVLKNEVYTGTLVWNRQHKSQGRPRPKDPKEIIRIENNHPAVIGREIFEKVQELLKERSPEITHPRTINSDYLLSGFLYCGKCGSSMLGCSAKSSRFFYYACHNYCKRGKDVCNAKLIKKERIEGFVIDRIKANLLTEDNLRELVKLTNEEISQAKGQYEERLAVIEAQLEEVRRRLHKLYDALETGKLEVEDLAPRIKELKAQMDGLEEKRSDLVESIREAKVDLLEASVVRAYIDDLKALLSKGSIVEQKSFLRSFVKRIEVNLLQVVINYAIPLKTQKVEPLEREVLPFAYNGSPGKLKARTFQTTFLLPRAERRQRSRTQMPARTYRNPIIMAQEWKQAISSGEYRTQAEFARRQGISRARVTQVLQLLNLAPDVLHTITALDDPLPSQVITERMLRFIVDRSADEQRQEIWRILTHGCPMTDSTI